MALQCNTSTPITGNLGILHNIYFRKNAFLAAFNCQQEHVSRRWVKSMRDGFTTKLFNQRGVHGFSAGKNELKIANFNHERADALDLNGYSRFATTMRDFAKRYKRDAARDAARDPYGDS